MNDESKYVKRVVLEKSALAEANILLKSLKDKHCKVSLSELLSEIVLVFTAKYLKKEKKRLEEIFFDDKKYIKNMLGQNVSKDEFIKSLEDLVKKKKKLSGDKSAAS